MAFFAYENSSNAVRKMMQHSLSWFRICSATWIPLIPGISISRMAIWNFSFSYNSSTCRPFSASNNLHRSPRFLSSVFFNTALSIASSSAINTETMSSPFPLPHFGFFILRNYHLYDCAAVFCTIDLHVSTLVHIVNPFGNISQSDSYFGRFSSF